MSLRGRFIILIILLVMAVMFISPSLQWYFLIPEESKNLALGSLNQIKKYATTKATDEYLAFRAYFTKAEKFSEFGRGLSSFMEAQYKTVSVDEYKAAVETIYRENILAVKQQRDLTLQLGLDLQGGLTVTLNADFQAKQKQAEEQARKAAADAGKEYIPTMAEIDKDRELQDIMTRLLSRFDQFGTVEPLIRRQMGSDNIFVELPGAADTERVNKVIQGKGTLNFHIVDQDVWSIFSDYIKSHPAYNPTIDNNTGTVILPADFPPMVGTVILGSYKKDNYGMDVLMNFIPVRMTPELSGEAIQDARAQYNIQTRKPEVTFLLGNFTDTDGLTKDGAALFGDITTQNKGKFLAVVMDNKVMSYASIKDAILTGQVQVSGEFTYKDADDLAKVLKTGSLPVPLSIINSAKVGPSLGDDTIRHAINGAMIGAILVFLFMLLYYKGAGFYACIALLFNMFFLLALLSVTRFTLTLTSIAGIVLTIGMAVDANVVIYERIKEEYHLGKSAKSAIKAGFDRAFWTILDANVTTFIAGMVLALFTKGSIQGFAFTLCVGIVTSLFTALVVSRILFDFTTDVLGSTKLSISWRRLQ
ncbi:MAG: protein translocase subunit SecD [Spirochaetaceae bacterium]|nr:MAG: protein translocase subunit SecD [Spirochaetaceae bacterium]